MAQRQPPSDDEARSVAIQGGFAGAGSGTFLAALADNIPDDEWYKSWLVILAPAISIGISGGWIWVRHWLSKRSEGRELSAALAQAKRTLQEAIDNPNTPEHLKQTYREDLAQLGDLVIRSDVDRVILLLAKRTTIDPPDNY